MSAVEDILQVGLLVDGLLVEAPQVGVLQVGDLLAEAPREVPP
jgi:hypothetical protein